MFETVAVIALTIVFLLAAGILSAEESAVALMPRGRVRRLVEAERRGATALEVLAERPSRVAGAGAIFRALAFACAAVGGWAGVDALVDHPASPWVSAAGAAVAVAVVFSLGDALPRTLAVANPEGVGLDFAPIARPLVSIGDPVACALAALWRWGVRLAGGQRGTLSPWAAEDEVRSVTTPDEETAREEAEDAILDAVSDFAEKVVREVMVPRTGMACLPDTATVDDAIALVHEKGFSRLPVYHETMDDIRGVLYAKDLLIAMRKGLEVGELATIARPPYFVPETKPIEELFVEMRRRTHIAIVADEYGGTAGLVTIEDLIEEIVGEIFDEYDREEPLVIDLGDGRFRLDARLPIDDVNERFGTAVDLDADTIGGAVSVVAGHIPEIGESVEIEGLRLTVVEREPTRVRQLDMEPVGTTDEEESHDA